MKPLVTLVAFLALLAAVVAGAGGANGSAYSPGSTTAGKESALLRETSATSRSVRRSRRWSLRSRCAAVVSCARERSVGSTECRSSRTTGRPQGSPATGARSSSPPTAHSPVTSGTTRFLALRDEDPEAVSARRAARLVVLRRALARRQEAVSRRAHLAGPSPKYRVRAYDLAAGRLLPNAVIDRLVSKAIMGGQPVTRATTPGGRWAYTLYARAEGQAVRARARHRPEAGLLHRPSAEARGSGADAPTPAASRRRAGRAPRKGAARDRERQVVRRAQALDRDG